MKKTKKQPIKNINHSDVNIINNIFLEENKSSKLSIDLNHCNDLKFNQLFNMFDNIMDLKNLISVYCHENKSKIVNDYDLFICDYKIFNNKHLNSWEIQTLFQEVSGHYHETLTRYLNKAKFISTDIIKPFSFSRYKITLNKHTQIKYINEDNQLTNQVITQLMYLPKSPKQESFKLNVNTRSNLSILADFIFKNSTIDNNKLNFDVKTKKSQFQFQFYINKYSNELAQLNLIVNKTEEKNKEIVKLERKIKAYIKLQNIIDLIREVELNKPDLYSRLISLIENKQLRLLSKVKLSMYKTGTHARNLNFSHVELIHDESNSKHQYFFKIKKYATLQNIHSKNYIDNKYDGNKELIKSAIKNNKLKTKEELDKEFNDYNYLYLPLTIKYQNLINRNAQEFKTIFPSNAVSIIPSTKVNATNIYVHSNIIPELFPQHGIGRKHTRSIKLTDWQLKIRNDYPWQFLEGFIHSDGSIYMDRIYQMIAFTNRSLDIINLFTETCDLLNVHYTLKPPSGNRENYDIFIRTRPSVIKVLENIQLKT